MSAKWDRECKDEELKIEELGNPEIINLFRVPDSEFATCNM